MTSMRRWLAVVGLVLAGASCTPTPPPPVKAPPPGKDVYRIAARRFAAIVVSPHEDIDAWLSNGIGGRSDADGGSAAPVAPDGYFLTADHVLARTSGRHVFVVRREDGRLRGYPARVVWRSADQDLALVHAEVATPEFYLWTPSGRWQPQGTPVMHAGVATGFRGGSGKLVSPVPPGSAFGRGVKFKHDIPLEPGDSGGPVVDAQGLLVGINSAVEYLIPLETAFFIESEANRPNVARLMRLIADDRRHRPRPAIAP